MGKMRYFILLLLIWVLWASFSTGGLYELKQINPEYDHPNKSVAFLTSKLDHSKSNEYWSKYHVEQCSLYMPNWAKTESCVRGRLSCEYTLPQEKDPFGNGTHGDIFSEKFRSCWSNNRPFTGPVEWARLSRGLWRAGIGMGAVWLSGGFDKKSVEELSKWENENKGWTKLVTAWVEKGR